MTTTSASRSAPTPRPERVRSLFPKEHGAYGQLGAPLLAALVLAWEAPSAWLYAATAVCGFLAHEPALVLLGHRGPRIREADGARARIRLTTLLALGGVAGATGAWLGPLEALAAWTVPVLLTVALAPLLARRAEKTFLGETLAAAALCGTALPVLVSGGAPWRLALGIWAGLSVGFSATSVAVRTALVTHKPREARREPPLLLALAIQSGLLAALCMHVHVAAAGGAPALLASWVVGPLRPHPRHFRRVGWTLAAASVAACGLVIGLALP